jgi:cytidylate kinase
MITCKVLEQQEYSLANTLVLAGWLAGWLIQLETISVVVFLYIRSVINHRNET